MFIISFKEDVIFGFGWCVNGNVIMMLMFGMLVSL